MSFTFTLFALIASFWYLGESDTAQVEYLRAEITAQQLSKLMADVAGLFPFEFVSVDNLTWFLFL